MPLDSGLFTYPATQTRVRDLAIDLFAGGGGASQGFRQAVGRDPDVAINHSVAAIEMHRANHPNTLHFNANVWQADPDEVLANFPGRDVAFLWASPDCRHFSNAKGSVPVAKNIRDLAWVVVLWAQRARPTVIALENVEEFLTWGPLGADGKPCKDLQGETFSKWKRTLERLGYVVESKVMRACDFGAPTGRKRLFIIARCDGRPIVWPTATHGAPEDDAVLAGQKAEWLTSADIIDWSIPAHSIFLQPEEVKAQKLNCRRPLAIKSLNRVARGIRRFVLGNPNPHLVRDTQAAYITQFNSKTTGAQADLPLPTVTSKSKLGIVSTSLAPLQSDGSVKTGFLGKYYGTAKQGQSVATPLHTVTSKARFSLSETKLSEMVSEELRYQAWWCARFVESYDPAPTDDLLKDERFSPRPAALFVGKRAIIDITLRMLQPSELFKGNGFEPDTIINPEVDGKPITLTDQNRLCGNAVPPQFSKAIVRDNAPEEVFVGKKAA